MESMSISKNELTWIYYRLNKNYITYLKDKHQRLSSTLDAMVEEFSDPSFLVLHGSSGGPIGCIHPYDAGYWKFIETKHLVDLPVQVFHDWEIKWQPINYDEDAESILAYASTRWYPFTLNGMRLIAEFLFYISIDCLFPILSVKNRFGLMDMIYDEHEEFDMEEYIRKGRPNISREEWSQRAERLLGHRAIIDDTGYELHFTDAYEAMACGIVYEVSPFECAWSMYDGLSSQRLWVALGVRDDFSDLCLCHRATDTHRLISYVIHFCKRNHIKLLECSEWHERLEFDKKGREIFPPISCIYVI